MAYRHNMSQGWQQNGWRGYNKGIYVPPTPPTPTDNWWENIPRYTYAFSMPYVVPKAGQYMYHDISYNHYSDLPLWWWNPYSLTGHGQYRNDSRNVLFNYTISYELCPNNIRWPMDYQRYTIGTNYETGSVSPFLTRYSIEPSDVADWSLEDESSYSMGGEKVWEYRVVIKLPEVKYITVKSIEIEYIDESKWSDSFDFLKSLTTEHSRNDFIQGQLQPRVFIENLEYYNVPTEVTNMSAQPPTNLDVYYPKKIIFNLDRFKYNYSLRFGIDGKGYESNSGIRYLFKGGSISTALTQAPTEFNPTIGTNHRMTNESYRLLTEAGGVNVWDKYGMHYYDIMQTAWRNISGGHFLLQEDNTYKFIYQGGVDGTDGFGSVGMWYDDAWHTHAGEGLTYQNANTFGIPLFRYNQ